MSDQNRVLLAMVGSHDPNPANHAKRPASTDGPILTTLTYAGVEYDSLVLLWMPGKDRKDVPYADRVATLKAIVEREFGVSVSTHRLPIANPSDMQSVLRAITHWVRDHMVGHDPEKVRVDVDLSPGTPASTAAWLFMVAGGLLPARMLRSTRAEDAEDGMRVFEVPLQEDFPEIILPEWARERMERLQRENRRLRQENLESYKQYERYGIITRSPRMRELLDDVARVAVNSEEYGISSHIMLTGETGTGKELVARMIAAHIRPGKPFRAFNASVLRPENAQAVLFGSERGAATGVERKKGMIREVDGGVLFLDEIGGLPLDVQSMLLRYLQDGTVSVFAGKEERVDVRVIAATNRDLEQAVEEGRFRRDLLARFAEAFHLPPLRQRPEDIRPLVHAFLEKGMPKRNIEIADRVIHELEGWRWPGNVRELEALVNQLLLRLDTEETRITPTMLRRYWTPARQNGERLPFSIPRPTPDEFDLKDVGERFRGELLRAYVEDHPDCRHASSGKPNYRRIAQRLMGTPQNNKVVQGYVENAELE